MRRWIPRNLARLVLAAALLGPAPAQAGSVDGPIARLRVEGRYDQNLMEGGGDGAGLLQPMFGWRLQSPTTELEASYAADLIGYAHGGAERGGVNHRLRGLEEFQLDRRTVIVLRQGAERVYDPTALSRPGVVRAAGTSTYAEGQFDLQHRLTYRWTGGLRYRAEVATLEAENAVDGAVHAPGAWASWAWSRRDVIGGGYRLQYFDTFGAGLDAYSHEPTLTWARVLGVATRLELEAGPAIFSQGDQQAVVPTGRVSVTHRRPRLELSAYAGRGLVGSTGFEGALWADAAGGHAIWRIAEPLRAGVALGVFRNGRAPSGDSFVEGFAGELSVEYALWRELAAEAAWRRVAQINLVGDEAIDLSRNIFAVGLTWHFQGSRLPR